MPHGGIAVLAGVAVTIGGSPAFAGPNTTTATVARTTRTHPNALVPLIDLAAQRVLLVR